MNYIQSMLELFFWLTFYILKNKQHQIHEEKRHVTKCMLSVGGSVLHCTFRFLISLTHEG